MQNGIRLTRDFFTRDVLVVAPELVGKTLAVNLPDSVAGRYMITEVEAYNGSGDLACHASKGRTPRTEIMYSKGGHLYIYLIYGMYWMLNVVTGEEDNPQAVLIRGLKGFKGPGRLTKSLGITKSLNREDVVTSEKIWFEDAGIIPEINTGPRIGIDYAGDYWKTLPWRYYV
jgi:DNA-3-methyladenine glycosylase